jgi:inorganic pyrophosphatase
MAKERIEPLRQLDASLFAAHPWHGVSMGDKAPEIVTTYIEIVPTDTIKYEMDKAAGLLRVDRPQKFSNICPTYYGFVPQTFCGDRVAVLMSKRSGRGTLVGDGDPLDICVLSDRTINHGNILLNSLPIGGLSLLDGNEADDKIIAVMEGDSTYGGLKDISEVAVAVIDRLKHYFLTYKAPPDGSKSRCEITEVYGREEAHAVIRASHQDYLQKFGDVTRRFVEALRG